jgi:hypothetical protein
MSPLNPSNAKDTFEAERRTEPRYPVSLEARLHSMSASSKTARLTDLSVGGCYVTTILSAEMGETVELEIILPTGKSFSVSGIITFHDTHLGFGIKFNLNEQQREFLEDLIDFARQDH